MSSTEKIWSDLVSWAEEVGKYGGSVEIVSYHKIYYISLLFNFYFKAGTTYYDNDELYKVWTVLRIGAGLVLARVAGTVEEDDITLLARNHHQSLVCHSF